MPGVDVQGSPTASGRHLLLYDGVCGLCNGLIQAVLAGDRRSEFHFAALQSPVAAAVLDRFGSDPHDLDTFHVVADYRSGPSRHLTKGRAVLFVMTALDWPWRAAGLLTVLPDWVLNTVYDLVARHRYRVFGQYERCPVPRPEHRDRFIDQGDL